MRALLRLGAFMLMFLCTAHRSHGMEIASYWPLYSERDAILVPEIEGSWELELFGVDTILFERAGDNFYNAILSSSGITSRFEAVFTKIGGSLFLDLVPERPAADCCESYQESSVPVHSLIMIAMIGDSMRLAGMNYSWFYDNIIAEQSMGNYLLDESKVILTLPTDNLRAFLSEHLHESGFWGEEIAARRLEHSASDIDSGGNVIQELEPAGTWTGLMASEYACIHGFPSQDGWFGGDGGLPVPISASKTVWLFGDTYVGQKDQESIQGAKMVTTIGVSTCESDGKMSMRYYWRNMYTDHPDHFFQPRTSRYKFWPLAAFMYRGNMYVILTKIGPLLGSSPDNIFNWSAIGTTMAKVTAPAASPPLEWKIDLIPWSSALDANLFGGGYAQDGSFVYFFMSKNDRQNYILRLPLNRLETPDGNIEYFSQDGTWKPGSDSGDAKVLFEDRLISRVIYVSGLHQWLAVYGPYFGGNSIYFRTAPAIVGPWSEREVLYDCPELKKGSPEYDEDSFCYCAYVLSADLTDGICRLLVNYSCQSSKTVQAYVPRVVEIDMPY